MRRRNRTRFQDHRPSNDVIAAVRSCATGLHGFEDLDPLMERVGDARFVLLGEASHGTAEYYDWRARISQRLIREKGFSFIAVEGDWPDCYRVNRYVKGYRDAGHSAREVLSSFERWPTWMWANEEVIRLAEWLHDFNQDLPDEEQVGFYGLDVYSLWDSMHAILEYLDKNDGPAAAAARKAFACFEPFEDDEQEYARSTLWVPGGCKEEVVQLLRALATKAERFDLDGREAEFNVEQNALVAKNAEKYYRTMVRGDGESWNVRDGHMAETLNRLMRLHGPRAKAIVWEHNTHVGDARYTDMAGEDMVNVGQLVRERHGEEDVVIVGFASHRGTVIAGDTWGAEMKVVKVPPAPEGSWEAILHDAFGGDRLLIFDRKESRPELLATRGHRAIGVVYRPMFEAFGNYVPTVLPKRYDVLAYLDETHALHPLHLKAAVEHEVPETYPSGV